MTGWRAFSWLIYLGYLPVSGSLVVFSFVFGSPAALSPCIRLPFFCLRYLDCPIFLISLSSAP